MSQQTTFTIEEISVWLKSYNNDFLDKLSEHVSEENIIKANAAEPLTGENDPFRTPPDLSHKKYYKDFESDFELYPGNEAGAFDYLDQEDENIDEFGRIF